MKKINIIKIIGNCYLFVSLQLIVLKLLEYLTWSWWWITAPIWIPVGIYIIMSVIGIIGAILVFKEFKGNWDE